MQKYTVSTKNKWYTKSANIYERKIKDTQKNYAKLDMRQNDWYKLNKCKINDMQKKIYAKIYTCAKWLMKNLSILEIEYSKQMFSILHLCNFPFIPFHLSFLLLETVSIFYCMTRPEQNHPTNTLVLEMQSNCICNSE